ncbi:iron-sulfur cluster biosynthesis family protein [Lactiplantibacillus daowaiensis]|uniref:Iron-sulfur cluster biosynthesis family protein n=1 Tax=Lactiplantibacillus daowaiensis TaxID=2559918 RepID=A0ABW1RZX6_9LACO|nr:iron-sulfur cluster biosynthesis family protein [Lactiplantibacillus daowaiensis]
MPTIQLSDTMLALLARKQLLDKTLILLADDGGGKYSLHGGACSIGTKFTLIVLDQPDPAYSVKLTNPYGVHLWTSTYDLMFFNDGITMDYQNGRIAIKDNAHVLDHGVQIANGADVLAAFKAGVTIDGTSC